MTAYTKAEQIMDGLHDYKLNVRHETHKINQHTSVKALKKAKKYINKQLKRKKI